MNHILIQFPVFDGSLAGEPMSKPRSAVTSNGGRVRNVAQQTKLPPRKTPGKQNLGQLVGAAKALLDYYGPVIEELSTEAQERDLYHLLEKALAPFLREAAARGGKLTREPKPMPHRAKLHVMPTPEPEPEPERLFLPFSLKLFDDGTNSGYFIEELRTVLAEEVFDAFMKFLGGGHTPVAMNPATGQDDRIALGWDVELFFEDKREERAHEIHH